MNFTFETVYTQKAMTTLAKVLRKTVRRKRSRRSHIFGWLVIVLAALLTISNMKGGFHIDFNAIVTWVAALLILAVLLFEDKINGYIARKRLLKGLNQANTAFDAEGYTSVTQIGETRWHYDSIQQLAETTDYFVFIFDRSHGQVYDKNSLTGGSVDEFRTFLAEATGKTVIQVK